MCGRFTRYYSWKDVHAYLSLFSTTAKNLEQRYNIAPTSDIEIVRDDGGRQMQAMRWGLLPPWAKDLAFSSKTFNARCETLHEKPSFRSAFKARRCLVPVSGFYEWKAKQQPLHITLPDQPVMVMAGLWELNQKLADEPIYSFTIITTSPNDFMADIHSRMPVILPADAFADWLDPETPAEALRALTQPYVGDMTAVAVDKAVGSVRNQGEHLIEPLPPTLL